MIVVVPTMVHSGTHVLRYNILKAKLRGTDTDRLFNCGNGNRLIGFHKFDYQHFQPACEIYPVFTSLRHPRRMAKSYEARYKDTNDRTYIDGINSLDSQWRFMIDFISKYNPMYLHVDHEIRDHEVDLISNAVGVDLPHDFSVGKRSGSRFNNHEIPLEDCPQVPAEYEDFYYQAIDKMKSHSYFNV